MVRGADKDPARDGEGDGEGGRWVAYTDGGGTPLDAYVAGISGPAVVVYHTAIGVHDAFITGTCERLARELGCVAVAVDLYGAGATVVDAEDKARRLAALRGDRLGTVARAEAGIALARALPGVDASRGVAAVGYCLGGGICMDLARSGAGGLAAAVSFHGVLGDASAELPLVEGCSATECLVCHGRDDPYTPPAALDAFRRDMRTRGFDGDRLTVLEFSGVLHGFMRPEKVTQDDRAAGHFYDGDAAGDSWDAALALLRRALQL